MMNRYSRVFPPCLATSSPAARAEPPRNFVQRRYKTTNLSPNLSLSDRQRRSHSDPAELRSLASQICPGIVGIKSNARYWATEKLTTPYSFAYEALTQAPGSFPCFLTGTKAAPSRRAIIGPRRNPRASRPTTTSIFLVGDLAMVCDVI